MVTVRGTSDDGQGAAETTAPSQAPDSLESFWTWFFRLRALLLALAAIAFVAVEAAGDRRLAAAGLLAVLVPYNLVLATTAKRERTVPTAAPVIDFLVAGLIPWFMPELWLPAIAIMVGAYAMWSVVLSLTPVLLAVLMGTAALAGSGIAIHSPATAALGVAAHVFGAAMAVTPVAALARRETALRDEHRHLIENVSAIVYEVSIDSGGLTYMSPAAQRLLGYPQPLLEDYEFWLQHVHPQDRLRVEAERRAAVRTRRGHEHEFRFLTGDDKIVWLHDIMSAERDPRTGDVHLRGIMIDVTDRRSAEQDKARYGEIVDHLDTALLVAVPDHRMDDELVVAAANPAAAEVFGVPAGTIEGRLLADQFSRADPSLVQRIRATSKSSEPFEAERVDNLGVGGHKIHSVRAFPLPDGAVGVALEDVTTQATVAAALRRQALHDGLTGLPNRTLLRERLSHTLSDARRRDERVALILMDLDHFKEVNDALGHQYGDRLLVSFAARLQKLLRECDTIARLGGDEFALLLSSATNEGAERVVRKVTEAMQEPFEIDGVTVQTSASLGVALFPDHATDADLLTQRADVAMYTAKRGGGGWSVYSPAHDQSSIERVTLLAELHQELDDEQPTQLEVHYQPIQDLKDGEICGAEALIRWPHPTLGHLRPELIVELAELSGLIQPLCRAVARTATETAREWLDDGKEVCIAINLSARNLYDRNLTRWVEELLDNRGLPARLLKCELTESEVMDDPVLAMTVLGQLREIGVHTAIDDFGTGYSSLSYLRQLPVDEIKIDKSFVTTMRQDAHDLTIVRTVIDLSHNLGFSVLAEGVEDLETLEMLADFGCDKAQGYAIGRPAPKAQFWTSGAAQAAGQL